MRALRLVPLTVVVVLLIALTSWWDDPSPAQPAELDRYLIPVAGTADTLSSTWYCAAGPGTQLEQSVVLVNPSDSPVEARLTAYNADGEVGSHTVEVEAASNRRASVGNLFGNDGLSVMVESASGELVVEHRLISGPYVDQVPCSTSSSQEWYFPAQSTVLGSSAQLVLFNPFSSDAGVDISAAVDDGVRVPPEWQGIVVPAGTTRVVDLGEHVQRREQFSVAVVSRIGRVVAESVQTYTQGEGRDVVGVRLQLGVPGTASDWSFAPRFTGAGVREPLVVFNPGEAPASVIVQVTPVGGAEMPPEPFLLEVPARRHEVIDLGEEGRVPTQGHHSITVETDPDTPVVVGRVNHVVAGPGEVPAPQEGEPAIVPRPNVAGGTSMDTGTPVLSTRWVVPLVITGGAQDPQVVVHNPGADAVLVSASTLAADGSPVVVMDEVEVPARDGVVVALAGLELPEGDVSIVLTSTSPVVVERIVTFADQDELSVGLAVPVPPSGGGMLPALSEL